MDKTYVAIDLKSFYASVECVDRGLDPLRSCLVVADESRTDGTICLAVSPALKAMGIPGRPRLFEVRRLVEQINSSRREAAPGGTFAGGCSDAPTLEARPELSLDVVVAPPRMARYMAVSGEVYSCYLRYAAPEDIHVYSVDEVFIDATDYIRTRRISPREYTMLLVREVLRRTGITATAGIGTNLYLAKIAMDIVAKRMAPDADGVRIAELDEMSYRRALWAHRPLTDFWRVGPGTARRLEKNGLYTMGDVARCSLGTQTDLYNEELLYRLLGVNAGLLIDHAWGWESCTIADIRACRPASSSLSSSQVLPRPYPYEQARLIVREMTDAMVMNLVEKQLVTAQLTLTLHYDRVNLSDPARRAAVKQTATDWYGRPAPGHAHGSVRLETFTSSGRQMTAAMDALFERIAEPQLLVRRVTVTAEDVRPAGETAPPEERQLSLFDEPVPERERTDPEREKRMQQTILAIRERYGSNAIVRGMNLQQGATAMERSEQIGGHKA